MTGAILDIPVFKDTTVPKDTPAVDVKYPCEICGQECEYSGRGRPPTKCAEHKSTKSSGKKRASGLGSNATLAAQAAEALVQFNGLVAILLMLAQMPMTVDAIETAKDGFREAAYEALLTDPALCKTILKGGTASGKIALLIAYGMFAGAVGPVAYMEYKEKARIRREERDALAAEIGSPND
jgi:hypothetical protein